MNSNFAPLSLLTSNPRYFLFRGNPEILITSSEHYGALLNLDFDYIKYFTELKNCGLNATRLFSGYYHEIQGAFNIDKNTLAPDKDAYLAPWARTCVPGARDGGNKFDLDHFNPRYTERLHSLCKAASDMDIVIEFCLFCPFYSHTLNGGLWEAAPVYHENNINNTEPTGILDCYSLNNQKIIHYQEALVKMLVGTLNEYDNIYYEICNEPYFDGITYEWQCRIAKLITDTERPLKNKHLIGINVSNGFEAIQNPDENFSVFNFHYTNGSCMTANYKLNKAIGCNETGFAGMDETFYRRQAWDIIMSGGATYFGLDFSFAPGYEDGGYVGDEQPGTGNRVFRMQLGAMKKFLAGAGVFQMRPDNSFIAKCFFGNGQYYGVAEPGSKYAVYAYGAQWFELDVPGGQYEIEWLNPINLKTVKYNINHTERRLKLDPPDELWDGGRNTGEIAVRLRN